MSAATKTATPASPTFPKDRQPELRLPPPLLFSTGKYPILTRPLTPSPVLEIPYPPLTAPVGPSPGVETQLPLQGLPELVSTPGLGTAFAPTSPRYSPQARRKRKRALESLPSSEVPPWLNLLVTIQRGSIPITFLLVAGVLAVYGWSVYSQRAWSQTYRQLTQLQRQERELIAASETRKQQIAHQAESSSTGLVRQVPAKIVFLAPQPRQKVQPKPKLSDRLVPQALSGY